MKLNKLFPSIILLVILGAFLTFTNAKAQKNQLSPQLGYSNICTNNKAMESTNLSNVKVVLPISLDTELKKDEKGRFFSEYIVTPHIFTLEEALKILIDKSLYYRFEDLLEYNIPLRKAMRKYGVATVVKRILDIAPKDERLTDEAKSFIDKHPDGSLGEYDIQIYSILDDIELFGTTIHGLKDLENYIDLSLYDDKDEEKCSRKEQHKKGKIHVGYLWQPYPKFDSEDEADDRYYKNYIIRKYNIKDKELIRFKNLPYHYCASRICENMPLTMLPAIYYRGDGGYLLLAF